MTDSEADESDEVEGPKYPLENKYIDEDDKEKCVWTVLSRLSLSPLRGFVQIVEHARDQTRGDPKQEGRRDAKGDYGEEPSSHGKFPWEGWYCRRRPKRLSRGET